MLYRLIYHEIITEKIQIPQPLRMNATGAELGSDQVEQQSCMHFIPFPTSIFN